MCTPEEQLPEKVRMPQKDLGINISLCHAIAMARWYGWTLVLDKYQSCYGASLSMGFLSVPPDVADGTFQESIGLWGMNKKQAAAYLQIFPRLEFGKYDRVLVAPLERANFEPHLIMVYGTPAQIWVLLSCYLLGTGKTILDAKLTAGGGCATYITRTMQTDEAQFILIGTGERIIPHAKDDECAFSIPISKIENTIQGLENGYKTGAFRYPIPVFMRYNSQHPPGYDKMRSHLLGE
jgi:uncharacterized protein (DUF169 family)